MNIFKTRRRGVPADASNGDAPDRASDASQALTASYDGLKEGDALARLPQLTQVELTAVETTERSHRNRPAVLNKLRYLRQREPLPGYDGLELEAISDALSGADLVTVKATREYERKHRNRTAVLGAIADALHRPDDEQPPVVGNGLPVNVKRGP